MIVSDINHHEFVSTWSGALKDIVIQYSGMGIQSFTHMSHDNYKCLGPYIAEWRKGAAPWHPSVVAHRLRAAHHAFFWLFGFREALIIIENLLTKGQSLDIIKLEFNNRLDNFYKKHTFPPNNHLTHIPDKVKW